MRLDGMDCIGLAFAAILLLAFLGLSASMALWMLALVLVVVMGA